MTIEIRAYEETSLGVLCLRRRELLSRPGTRVTEVTLDHEFLMSSYLTESERALSTFGLKRLFAKRENQPTSGASGDAGVRILVGGLGLGYTASAALDDPEVCSVEVVEFLPQVIGWMQNGLVPLSEKLMSESRLKITQGDIYERVTAETHDEQFELIAIDVDHSPADVLGEESSGFYTEAGLQRAKSHLSPGGIIGIWSYDSDTPLLAAMRNVFVDVTVEQVTVWNDLIDVEQTDWLFFGRREI